MYCTKCGKEINEEDVFCRFCGSPQGNYSQKSNELNNNDSIKVFNFGSHSRNNKSVSEINEWLHSQKIVIKTISLSACANYNIPLRWETVIERIEIEYENCPDNGYIYTMDYFTESKWIGGSYAKLDKELERWKSYNNDQTVLWEKRCGHQASGGNTRTLYFLYR